MGDLSKDNYEKVKAEVMGTHYCGRAITFDGFQTFNQKNLMKHYCPDIKYVESFDLANNEEWS